jgi:hypothetical protein
VIFAAENSNKFQKTRFWKKEKSVEDIVTLGPMAHATLVPPNLSSETTFALNICP